MNVDRAFRVLFLGAESSCHVTRWVEYLRRQGVHVQLATLHPTSANGAIHLVRREGTGSTPLTSLPRATVALRSFVRRFRPDVTIAYYLASYGVLARLAGIRPTVGVAVGGDVLIDSFDSSLHRLTQAVTARLALSDLEGLCVWSEHVARRTEALGFPRERTLVQPRGVNRALFAYRRPRPPDCRDPLRLISTRWLKPLYRLDTLIHGLGHLRDRGVPFRARIVGRGPDGPKLQRLAQSLSLGGCVEFVGPVPAERMPATMAWADCYVSTSCTDGASSSLFEALAVGLYPIVSEIPANRAFVEQGTTGDLFEVGDGKALATCLEKAALDRERLVRAVEAARPGVAARLDYETNMARINQFVLSLAGMSVSGHRSLTVPRKSTW